MIEEYQLATYGGAFKKLRVQKGFSRKEAATNIMSVQSLRNFEEGYNQTSIEHLGHLLLQIGATWQDFLDLYEGPTLIKELEMILDSEISSYINNGTTINILSSIPSQYSALPYFQKLAIVLRKAFANLVEVEVPLSEEDIQLVVDHMDRVDEWGELEKGIFSYAMILFSSESLIHYCNKFLKSFKNQHEIDHHFIQTFGSIFYAGDLLSKRGLYKEAHDIYDAAELILKRDNLCILYHLKENLLFCRSVNYLRENDPTGLELAKKVLETKYKISKNFDIPQLQRQISDAYQHIRQINKCNQPFCIDFNN